MNISFDFDSTLSEYWVQELAKIFISAGHFVYIVTSRCSGANPDLYKVADSVGISRNAVIFTEGAYKSETLKIIGAEWHFDDMEDERDKINAETDCLGLYVPMDEVTAMFKH